MIAFARLIDTRVATLPRGLALRWPGGRAGPDGSAVQLTMRRRQLLADLAQGRIGELADAYVRGD
ncbi:MAG TPA: SAM-dependent methyltransferase, partial [Rubrivivax sp.]|nr:SAM-dependent methyltransferase [Rubrivivax sp.]